MACTPNLSFFFHPEGVAVIGASATPGKLGHGVLRNLTSHGYSGPVYPVNPNADKIMGLRAYPSIVDVPDPLDLAAIVVPVGVVERELEACGRRGVKGVVIVSGGFREVGPEGAEREERIKQIAQQYGIVLLGPNCIGTIDTHAPFNITFVMGNPTPGDIAFLSQSGAMVAVIIDWAERSGIGFSRIVSLGNQAGVSETEMLKAIVQDKYTRVVTAYIEGVSDGQSFVETASDVGQGIPIVALKVGRGAGGAKAVASHTGALAGTEAAYEAAFRRAGVLRATTVEEMLDWARALAWQPVPKGNRVAVLTNAGGPGIVAVDALEAAGMQLAPLTQATQDYLRQHVPPAASVGNPVDILAGSGPELYGICLDALLADETVDAVVLVTAPQDWFEPIRLVDVVADAAESPIGRHKPVLTSIMGPEPASEAAQEMFRRRIPNVAFPDRLGGMLGVMWRRSQWLTSLAHESDTTPALKRDLHAAQSALESQDGWLPTEKVEALLRAYEILTPHSALVRQEEGALAAAESIGYPVALKLAVPGVTHKTEAGGVALNIGSPQALQRTYRKMSKQLNGSGGILVQQMVTGTAEMIAGMVRDPQFGPLLMVGGGGTLVELMGDVAFELAPVSRQQASDMLERTAAARLLKGYRGRPPADRETVITLLQSLAQIALDWPQITEIEVNPLVVMPQGEGGYAVDARVLLVEGV